jgi:hypothetical protein
MVIKANTDFDHQRAVNARQGPERAGILDACLVEAV